MTVASANNQNISILDNGTGLFIVSRVARFDEEISVPVVRSGIVSITDADSPYTVADDVTSILADATSGTITINLPAVSGENKRNLRIMKVDASGNAVTLDGDGSETINGSTTLVLSGQYDKADLITDAIEWFNFS